MHSGGCVGLGGGMLSLSALGVKVNVLCNFIVLILTHMLFTEPALLLGDLSGSKFIKFCNLESGH